MQKHVPHKVSTLLSGHIQKALSVAASSPIRERVKSQKVPSEIIRSPQVWFQMRGQGQFGDPGLDGS